LTGVTNLNVEVSQKRLELLRELLPAATIIAVLVNPSAPTITEQFMRALEAAAPALGMQLHVLHASTDRDLDTVFAALALQLPFMQVSESMGNHDSKIVDAASVD
jgi:putative ABC transport system substrate-binding protein